MVDIFDQVASSKPTGDIFDQVAPKQMIAPPPGTPTLGGTLSKQYASLTDPSQMHPANLITGGRALDIASNPTAQHIGDVAKGIGQSLYDVSTPGMAMSVLQQKFPDLANKMPLPQGGPVQQIPGKAMQTVGGMMLGGIEAEPPSPGSVRAAPEVQAQAPTVPSSEPSLGTILARHIPIVGRGMRAAEDAQQFIGAVSRLLGKDAPATPTNLAQLKTPIPETNGIQWGTGGQGPIDLRGKMIPHTTAPVAGQDIPLPNITPTKSATVDPYRQQMLPPMTKGVSGNIESHAYDPTSGTMYTHFKSGDIYKYTGVPQKVYDQFVNAESQGSFHYNNIRGRYDTTKLGKVEPTRTRGAQVAQTLAQGR